jgi:hypothetical protein
MQNQFFEKRHLLHNAETKEKVASSLNETGTNFQTVGITTYLIPLTYKVMHFQYYTSTWTNTDVFLR